MADNKKYYYLKLKENFFDTEEMKILESMKNGIEYQNVYLKMCLLSLKSDGALVFKNMLPYSIEMLSSVLRVNIDTVKTAVEIFQRIGLVTITDTETIYMSDIQALVGQSSTEAERIARYRQSLKQKEQDKIEGVQMYETCTEMLQNRTPEIRDKSIEIRDNISAEKSADIEKTKKQTFKNEDYKKVYDAYFSNCSKLYREGRIKVEKPVIPVKFKGTIKKAFEDYGVELVVQAVIDSIHHDWLVSKGYPFTFIFGQKELPNLINKTFSTSDSLHTEKFTEIYQKDQTLTEEELREIPF